ncbi:aryl hydrocarbon receptor [Echinops telfairi]|uniref:Aryl hydrocarbon receptor n=1 Tax=Echinops telfairi TaxID=9371 RepID=A0AC55CYN4_ECHTE|nr:aryl hydrocarbon receptor [Echinops telfairi]
MLKRHLRNISQTYHQEEPVCGESLHALQSVSRKRRKPVQKTVKPIPAEGIKSNPSKRHRDRLNTELDRLASLLPFPQDVINKLDKLSVLRLSVSYLRTKSFFDVAIKSPQGDKNGGQNTSRRKFREDLSLQEGEFLLQSDVIHQSVYELIHTEDRAEFQRQLHWAFNPSQCADSGQRIDEADGLSQPAVCYKPDQLAPENSSFLKRNFLCRLRCLLDNSSGFLAMNFQGKLKYLHGQNKKGKDGSVLPPQLALFAIATPLQSPSILEIRTKNFIFRTKHKLDFTPTSCDAKGKIVLGYTEAELSMRGSGYQFVHAADMLYCADSHIRMIKTGESGMVVFRLLTKENRWTWIQSNARLIYKNGRPDYIIATQRPLTEEEGIEHLQKRNMKLPFMFTTGEAVLYEVTSPFPPSMDPLPIRMKGNTGTQDSATKSSSNTDSLNPSSLLASLMQQDDSIYLHPASNSVTFERKILSKLMNECSNWQDSVTSRENENILKHEQSSQSPEIILSGDHADVFADNKNSELYSIMKHLGIDAEDIKHMQQNEEFFRSDFSGADDFGDLDIEDDVLTYVQESLSKSPFVCSGYPQQQSVRLNSSCMVQEHQQQLQHKQVGEQQQQLCQKMKHMQVNNMFANYNSNQPVPFSCPQQDPHQYNVLFDVHGANQEFPYKSEISMMPYTPSLIPCNQPVFPQHSNYTQLDFAVGNFEPSSYRSTSSNFEGFVHCLQVPENQEHVLNPQSTLVTPQTCYAGAVSMYQCQPESQHTQLDQRQYNTTVPGAQAFLNENGGVFNETYPAKSHTISNTQTSTYLQPPCHPSEAKPSSDLTSSRFL